METSCDLYSAVKSCNWKVINKYVKDGRNINASLISTGPEAGYTALHLAAMKKDKNFVKKLIKCGANVNSVSENGAQPIHLASLLENDDVVDVLLKAGANPNAELTKELYDKYIKDEDWSDDKEWSNEFGGKMPLLAYAVINDDPSLTAVLLTNNADLNIRGNGNTTLLMYAVKNSAFIVDLLLPPLKNNYPGLVNARDDIGWHALHFMLPIEGSPFHYRLLPLSIEDSTLKELIDAGADINVTVNGDPDTLFLNIAAYKHSYELLPILMNLDVPLSVKSRPLRSALLPVDHSMGIVRVIGEIPEDVQINKLKKETQKFIEFVLENYVFRREFGMFVPEEEKNLMDKLIANDTGVRKIVKDYENTFINGTLKNEIIAHHSYGKIIIYEAVKKIFDNNSLKSVVKDDNLMRAYKTIYNKRHSYKNRNTKPLIEVMMTKIKNAYERRILFEEVEKIKDLRLAVPLPYELVLMIFEYLDNKCLTRFVNAFYQCPITFQEFRY